MTDSEHFCPLLNTVKRLLWKFSNQESRCVLLYYHNIVNDTEFLYWLNLGLVELDEHYVE